MSRKRKLYLSEFITRNKYNQDIYIINYNNNSVKYDCRDDAIKILSSTELWNKEIKEWFKAREFIIVKLD